MLGRQQIAGIPTAISELFKNAHDAYAERGVVDYFRSDQLFVLRDDGLGMTKDEFEERWLTLGTESKLVRQGIENPPTRAGYPTRAVLGEKGIGRLAIAAIGPQVLVVTRPLRGGQLGDVVAAYLHWGLFEVPGINLDQVEIPIKVLSGGALPDKTTVSELTATVIANLDDLKGFVDAGTRSRISKDIKAFQSVDPAALAEILGAPSLRAGPGTQFYIRPASAMVAHELDEEDPTDAGPLRKTLMGFANTMTPGHPDPPLHTAFWDHYTDEAEEDVIGEGEFFTPEEFLGADHRIHGRFDEFGQFEGSVEVYGEEEAAYRVPWLDARGETARCGPFAIDIAYVQGRSSESRLDPERFAQISKKLDLFGGIYVYRDGIRVLPYGNNDVDWLDVEVRRAKSASDWFFSYRRMFGAILLHRSDNAELREKAGREGFADNEAYRQFRAILKAFLRQVAIDFFRESGSLADRWRGRREELVRLDRARKAREGQVRAKRKLLGEELDRFFARIDRQEAQAEAARIVARARGEIEAARAQTRPGDQATALVAAEESARSAISALGDRFLISRPRGLGLTQDLARTMAAYDDERARIEDDILAPALAEVEGLVSRAASAQKLTVDRRIRFDRVVSLAVDKASEQIRVSRRELQTSAADARAQANALGKRSQAALNAATTQALGESARIDVGKLSDQEFVGRRAAIERSLMAATLHELEAMQSVSDQIRRIVWPSNGSGPEINALDEMEAMETELEALRERAEQDLELTQIGMAVEVVDHEFRRSVLAIRRALQRIRAWADQNPRLREPYRDLSANFEHLDGYLRLLTPLHRRLYRRKVEIRGTQIEKFVRDVFSVRLTDRNIRLEATEAFRNVTFMQYPSTIYPVFLNLVDNSIWWLTGYRGDRRIEFDVDGSYLVVRDTGPGVSPRDYDAVFHMGFSRKPGGSGYGLFISKEVLNREGISLELVPPSADIGAEFRMGPLVEAEP
jgi:signal transduction histidine kinase/HEPN domain-containing protein